MRALSSTPVMTPFRRLAPPAFALAFALAFVGAAVGATASAPGAVGLLAVRFGGDATTTRIVLDLDASVVGKPAPDEAAGRIALALPPLLSTKALSGPGKGLVTAWSVRADKAGSRLLLDVAPGAVATHRFLIPPSGEGRAWRYVIDVRRSAPETDLIADLAAGRALTPLPPVAASTRPIQLATASVKPGAPKSAGPRPAVVPSGLPTREADATGGVRLISTPGLSPPTRIAASFHPPALSPMEAYAATGRVDGLDGAEGRGPPSGAATPAPTVPPTRVGRAKPPRLGAAPGPALGTASAAPSPSAGAPLVVASRFPVRTAPRRGQKVIVIDAGHGGHDPGARSLVRNEKDINLAAAQALKARLEASGRYRIVMTRDSDVFITLEDRVRIARRAGADLFISLHSDSAGGDPTPHGASIYTLSDSGQKRVNFVLGPHEWFANTGDRKSDSGVRQILLDLTQRSTRNRSSQFASVLIDHISDKVNLLPRSHRDAGYFVLLAPDVPAVLLEMGFITNPSDEMRLTDPAQREKLMSGVADAIDAYFLGGTTLAAG